MADYASVVSMSDNTQLVAARKFLPHSSHVVGCLSPQPLFIVRKSIEISAHFEVS
jgi:hypothetical protein